MMRHDLKIACRNLLKYKTQTIISVWGLAIGFACFALSLLWIRYEVTYDQFEGSDRIYTLYGESLHNYSGYSTSSPYLLAASLKRDMPEVDVACSFYYFIIESELKGEKDW